MDQLTQWRLSTNDWRPSRHAIDRRHALFMPKLREPLDFWLNSWDRNGVPVCHSERVDQICCFRTKQAWAGHTDGRTDVRIAVDNAAVYRAGVVRRATLYAVDSEWQRGIWSKRHYGDIPSLRRQCPLHAEICPQCGPCLDGDRNAAIMLFRKPHRL